MYLYCVLFVVLCIVCCVSQYCVVPTIKCKNCFKVNYITTMYFVLCIVCCVVYCLLCITVLCCVNNQMRIFQQNLFIFHKSIKIYFVKIIKCFFECCRFLNVCMQCSVDVTESLVEPLRVWCRYAVISLARLSRRSAGRWRP